MQNVLHSGYFPCYGFLTLRFEVYTMGNKLQVERVNGGTD